MRVKNYQVLEHPVKNVQMAVRTQKVPKDESVNFFFLKQEKNLWDRKS